MSAYNIDFYLILKYNASEKDVAMMFSMASLMSALTTLSILKFVRTDPKILHTVTILVQIVLFTSIAMASAIWIAVIIYTIRDAVAVFADSSLETLLIDSSNKKSFYVSAFQIGWEVFTGLGKFIGSHLAVLSPDLPLLVASIILLIYVVFFIYINKPNRKLYIEIPIHQSL
ncbi:MAG: hypothetical protein QXU31_05880 [Archaeoglobaceae archaeon]